MENRVQDHDRNKSDAPNNMDPSVNLNEAVFAETPVETFDFSGTGIFSPDDFLSVLLQCEVPVQYNNFNDSASVPNTNFKMNPEETLQKQQKKRHQRKKSRRRHNRKRRIHDVDEDESDSKTLNHVTVHSKSKRPHFVDACSSSNLPPDSGSNSGLNSVFTSTGNNRDELPQTSLVFSLDHVLEQILSLLSLPDLLNCRQVSHRWKSMTTFQLQKQVTFHFHQNNLYLSRWHIPRNKDLTKLTSLLRKTSEPFLCNKFVFTGSNGTGTGSLTDPVLQEFLNNYGVHIKELSLDFKPNFEFQTPHENQIIKSIQNMLLNQTPNLSYLFLDIISKIEWKNQRSKEKVSSRRNSNSPLKKSDVEFEEIVVSTTSTSSDFKKNKSKLQQPLKLNRSLKMLKLGSETPSAKVLESVIQASPSLREVDLNNCSVHFLLEPQNRLSFLKQLYLDRNCDIEVLENIVRTSRSGEEGNLLKLREITIDFKQNLFNNSDINPDTEEIEYQNRIVNVINQILDSSADSLQSIKLEGVTFLRRLKLPQEMPNVYKLELGNAYNWPRPGQDLFPPGFSLSKIFPNLRCVGLKRFTDREEFVHFLNSLNSEPVPTVKKLCVSSGYYESKKSENVLRIYTLFPNVPRS